MSMYSILAVELASIYYIIGLIHDNLYGAKVWTAFVKRSGYINCEHLESIGSSSSAVPHNLVIWNPHMLLCIYYASCVTW